MSNPNKHFLLPLVIYYYYYLHSQSSHPPTEELWLWLVRETINWIQNHEKTKLYNIVFVSAFRCCPRTQMPLLKLHLQLPLHLDLGTCLQVQGGHTHSGQQGQSYLWYVQPHQWQQWQHSQGRF